MIPAYKFNLLLQKKTRWPEVCDRIAKALEDAGGSADVTGFHFEETTSSKHVALKRPYKTCSDFEALELVRTTRYDDEPYTLVSTLIQPTQKAPNQELQAYLPDVLRRIGRSLPFHRAMFLLEGVPWKPSKANVPITDRNIIQREIPRDAVVLCNDWWVSGRELWLIVVVLPKVRDEALTVPAKAEAFIDSLGKVRNRELLVFPEAGENQLKVHQAGSGRTHEFAFALKALGDELMSAGKLHSSIGNDVLKREPGFSRKRIIQKAIKHLGFGSLNTRNTAGYLNFAKTTDRNNALKLSFDFGSWFPQCSAWLTLKGPLWSYTFELPYVNCSGPGEISTPGEFEKSISNALLVLEAAHNLIREIELRHDPSPTWYRPFDE